MRNELTKQLNKDSKNYIECDSAFNGFGIYNYNTFKHSMYKSIIDISIFDISKLQILNNKYNLTFNTSKSYDCEHRYFHITTKNKSDAKILLWKEYLFPPYQGEHARFLYK